MNFVENAMKFVFMLKKMQLSWKQFMFYRIKQPRVEPGQHVNI